MAAAHMRRSAAVAAVAALATVVPAFTAFAAPTAFAATSITTKPAPDSNNVVAANRPQIVATFNANLARGSITLVVKGTSGNLCGSPHISGQTVTCTPSADLALNKTYDAVGHGVDGSGHRAATSKLEFTVDYPKFEPASSTPIAGGSETQGNETLTAMFNEAVTGGTDTTKPNGAFKLFEVNADGTRGNQLPGTISFGGNPVLGSDGTVSFAPETLVDGKYEAVVLVNGEDSKGNANPAAIGTADYFIYVDGSAPSQLLSPYYANNTNNTAFPFSGVAAPGLTVTVTVPDHSIPGGVHDATGSGVVPPCASAPACPWTVKVDLSGLKDTASGSTQDWSAATSDANNKSGGSASGPGFVIDTTAPAAPTLTGPTITADSTHVNLSATDSDANVVSYLVTITDPEVNQLTPTFAASNHNLPDQSIDVTTLDDGQLNVLVQAEDAAGNLSKAQNPAPHVFKQVGLLPNLGTSTLTSDAGDTTFTDAESHAVLSPTTVTLSFTQPIKESYTDSTTTPGPTTHHSSMCITSPNGNCLTGGTPTVSSDHRSLILHVTQKLQDQTYGVRATTYSQGNCPDKTVTNASGYQCESFNDSVRLPNTGSPGQLWHFTVDSTPPTVAITAFTNPVTASNDKHVSISGTVDQAATSVQLIIRSSGSTTSKILVNAAITPPSGSATTATWRASPVDLSPLPDGKLTIKATAKKSSGLSGTDTATGSMRAHLTTITERTSKSRLTAGHATVVSGRLVDSAGAGIANATISVRPRSDSGTFGTRRTAVTGSNGAWHLTFVPQHNATFYASYAGAPTQDGASVHSARTLVRVSLTFTSPKPGTSVTSPVTLTGKVAPGKAGKTVTFYRHTSAGNTVLGRDRLDRTSHWSLRLALAPGSYAVFAKIGATSGNIGNTSVLLHFTVKG